MHAYQHFSVLRRGLSVDPMIGVNFNRCAIYSICVKSVKKARNSRSHTAYNYTEYSTFYGNII